MYWKWQKNSTPWFTFTQGSRHCMHCASCCLTYKWKLKPCWCRLKLLEQVRKWYPNHKVILCGNIYVDYKVFGRYRFDKQVHVTTSETQRLCACLWQLNVISSRNRSRDLEHCRFDRFFLEKKNGNAFWCCKYLEFCLLFIRADQKWKSTKITSFKNSFLIYL